MAEVERSGTALYALDRARAVVLAVAFAILNSSICGMRVVAVNRIATGKCTDLFDDPTHHQLCTLFAPPVIEDPLQLKAWVQNFSSISLRQGVVLVMVHTNRERIDARLLSLGNILFKLRNSDLDGLG